MSTTTQSAKRSKTPKDETISLQPPRDFLEILELRSAAIDHKLGYFGTEPFVIFGYCPGAAEVVWRDARAIGFGGGWRLFLWDIAPLVRQHGANIGTMTDLGTHVLFVNRARRAVYAAPRESAEAFLARIYGTPIPTRACLCSHTSCAFCPVQSCPKAGLNDGTRSCA